MVASLQNLQKYLSDVGYFANDETVQALRAMLVLQRPLLIEGPPGVGKTAIAYALSNYLKKPLLRVQCYEGIESDQLLYDYNYAKQLLMISMMKDKIHEKISGLDIQRAINVLDDDGSFWGEQFLIKRPLLQAISTPENHSGYILLIDEVDKTEKSTEALLLEVLSEYSISIPEYGTIKATIKPIVILTGNRTRELSDALRRRCVYLYIDYPTIDVEKAIIKMHVPDAEELYLNKVVEAIQKIRQLPLKRVPAISETIEVLKLLIANNGDDAGWLNVIAKHNEDRKIIINSQVSLKNG